MSLIPSTYFAPCLKWPDHAPNGYWLSNFISLLTMLPSKIESKGQFKAFSQLWEAASPFLSESDQEDSWADQIEAAATWRPGHSFMVDSTFSDYVDNDRRSILSYSDVLSYLKKHQRSLFGPAGSSDTLNQLTHYLKCLKELRAGAHAFIQYLDIDTPFEWTHPFDGKTYTFNPRKLYEEFKSHYAYETALCIPMY